MPWTEIGIVGSLVIAIVSLFLTIRREIRDRESAQIDRRNQFGARLEMSSQGPITMIPGLQRATCIFPVGSRRRKSGPFAG